MTLGEAIQDAFKTDAETILEDNLERLEGRFQYHEDGTVTPSPEIADAQGRVRMLTYIIAQRLMYEADDAESPGLDYEFFYELFDAKENTVQKWAQRLRDDKLIETEDDEHQLVPGNLPKAVDLIEHEIE